MTRVFYEFILSMVLHAFHLLLVFGCPVRNFPPFITIGFHEIIFTNDVKFIYEICTFRLRYQYHKDNGYKINKI